MPTVERTLARNGRSRESFSVRYVPFLVTGRDEAELADSAGPIRDLIAFYGSTPAYSAVLELHGWSGLHTDLHRLSMEGKWKAMGELISDEVLEAFAVVAPLELLGEAVRRRIAGIADRTSLRLPAGTDPDTTRSILEALRSEATA